MRYNWPVSGWILGKKTTFAIHSVVWVDFWNIWEIPNETPWTCENSKQKFRKEIFKYVLMKCRLNVPLKKLQYFNHPIWQVLLLKLIIQERALFLIKMCRILVITRLKSLKSYFVSRVNFFQTWKSLNSENFEKSGKNPENPETGLKSRKVRKLKSLNHSCQNQWNQKIWRKSGNIRKKSENRMKIRKKISSYHIW